MPGEEINTTLRFNADITDAKAAMQEATRATKLANSEFKAVAAGMDDWSNSTDGLSAKLRQLSTVQQAEERKLEVLKTAYQAVVKEQGENSAAAIDLATKINNQQAVVNKTAKEYDSYSAKLEEVEKAADGAADDIKKAGDAAKDAGEAAKESGDGWTIVKDVISDMVSNTINWAIDSFKELMTASSSSLSDLGAKTGATTEQLKAYDSVMKDIYRNNYGESFDDVSEAMATALQMFGELDNASLQNITQKAIALRDTFAMDYQESMRAVNSLMDQFGITADEAFNLIVQGAQQGLNQNDDLLDTVNEYSVQFKQAGYSADEMFNMLKNGTEEGTWSVDKLGDALKEYGIRAKDMSKATYEAFGQLGYDVGAADEAIAEHIKEIDKLEGQLRDAEYAQSKFNEKTDDYARTKNAEKIAEIRGELDVLRPSLELLRQEQEKAGETATEWQDRFAAGGETAKQATQELIDRIMAIEDPVQQMSLGVQFFGTMWEDLGADAVKALTDTEGGIKATNDAMTQMQNVKYDNLSDALGGLGRIIRSDLIQPIADTLEPMARNFVNWLIDNLGTVQTTIIGVTAAVAAYVAYNTALTVFKNGWMALTVVQKTAAAAQAALNLVMSANPIGIVVALIAGLVAAFVTAYKTSETFRNVVDKVWAALKKNGGAAVEWVVEKFKSLVEWFKKLPTNIGNAISGAVGKVTTWGSNLYNAAKTKVTETVSGVTKWFGELPGKIASAIAGAVDRVVSWGKSLAAKGAAAATSLVSSVVDGVKSLPGKMLSIGSNLASGLWQGLQNSVQWLKDKISSWVGDVLGFMERLFDINSPSGETEWQGEMLVGGYVKAIKKGREQMRKAMRGLGEAGLEALGGTPSAPNAPKAAGGKTIIFNQTNNSPRALSQREIFRQTHNALAFVGGN